MSHSVIIPGNYKMIQNILLWILPLYQFNPKPRKWTKCALLSDPWNKQQYSTGPYISIRSIDYTKIQSIMSWIKRQQLVVGREVEFEFGNWKRHFYKQLPVVIFRLGKWVLQVSIFDLRRLLGRRPWILHRWISWELSEVQKWRPQ